MTKNVDKNDKQMISYSSLYASDKHTCFFLTVFYKMTTFLDLLKKENVIKEKLTFCGSGSQL